MTSLKSILDKYGPTGLLPHVVRKILEMFYQPVSSSLDLEYGIETGQVVLLDQLHIDSKNARFGTKYEATGEGGFRRIVSELSVDVSAYTFLDYGCGKGRGLILAALCGFRRIIGVDFSPELCVAAESNVARFQSRSGNAADIDVLCADAADVEPPREPCVLYLFNPFCGSVLQSVCARIDESLRTYPRDLFVAYHNPQWRRSTFDRSSQLRVHASCIWHPDWHVVYRSRSDRGRESRS